MVLHRTAAGLALLACASAAPSEAEHAFKDFIAKYNRKYDGPEEEALRYKIFEATYNFIQAENAKRRSYFLVINEFADQAKEEFHTTHFGMSLPKSSNRLWSGVPRLGLDLYSGSPLPESIDWVEKGAVTKPKNQGHCGSCWSFSTTGALEGAWQIATGKLVSLSEQQLVDCSTENSGCKGGAMDQAFAFLKTVGTCTEASYPYKNSQNKCPASGADSTCTVEIPKGAITGYYDVPVDDTEALMEAVAKQPVSVAIEADQTTFQSYGGGVLTAECGAKLDHGVLLVGYGIENGTKYWKVKNSWGDSWGEQGYVRIERGVTGDGKCGIKKMSSYPEVNTTMVVPTSAPTSAPIPETTAAAPSCKDAEAFCTDKDTFNAGPDTDDCNLLHSSCMKSCGCCESVPWKCCGGPGAATNNTQSKADTVFVV